jgi:hypothetical protein
MIFKTDKPATNQISELPEHDSWVVFHNYINYKLVSIELNMIS